MSAADEYRLQAELLALDKAKLELRVAELEGELAELRLLKLPESDGRHPQVSRRQLVKQLEEFSERLTDEEVGDVVFLFMGKIVEVAETIRAVRERRVRK